MALAFASFQQLPQLLVAVVGLMATRRLAAASPRRASFVAAAMACWLVDSIVQATVLTYRTLDPTAARTAIVWITAAGEWLFFGGGCVLLLVACLGITETDESENRARGAPDVADAERAQVG
jgi:hypothetical protein